MSPKRAEPGAIFGGYELVRRIGRGGMAEVWVARKALGKKGSKFVAIKLIADHYVGDERYARMFRSEAELAAVLSHANIVQVFDEGEEDGRSYLIMEWVDGLNLLKLGDMLALLDDDQRRFRLTAYIIGQLLHALHYAHSITSADGNPLGVVHRDVSPQNVLVSNHGEVKLTDFGVAYQVAEESSGLHVKGKVRYMAPEQLTGKTRSPTVDLYAVGALMHELLDGRRFRGEFGDGQDLFAVVLMGKVSPLARVVPPELDRLRLRLLEPDATRRIQTAEDAIAMLKLYPDYGDARDELTKLCGSLTGVVRPRVGPGQSSQMAMAEQATTRWGGRKALAKPKVNGAVKRPPPPPPPAAAPLPSAPLRTGSTTVRRANQARKLAAQEAASPVITGHTEFVKPQGLLGIVAGAAVPANDPLPAPPLHYGDHAGSNGQGYAVPMYIQIPPSHPIDVRPTARASQAPIYMQEQRPYPIDVQPNGHANPRYFHPPPSWSIQAPPAPIWIDPNDPSHRLPTDRLPPPAAHGAPSGTDMPDASVMVEVLSGSGTDQEIVPRSMVGEGTDTRRDPRTNLPMHSSSASIVVHRRSAVVGIGLGLVLVAAMSVGVTWLLFTRGLGDGAHEGEGRHGVAAGMVEPSAAPSDPPPQSKTAELELPGAPARGAVERAPEAGPGEAVPAVEDVEVELVPEPPEPRQAAEVVPKKRPAVPKKQPPKPKPAPKVKVKLFGALGLDKGQLKIGAQTFSMDKHREVQVSAGKKAMKWRKNASDTWKSGGQWTFKPGKPVIISLTKDGPKPRYSNP